MAVETKAEPADAEATRGAWQAAPYRYADARRLVRELGVSETVAAVLARRGYGSPQDARRFLAAEENHDPFAFEGMRAACDLVLGHVRSGSRITVHGDYDVDGICATAVLVRALRAQGADCDWHLPSRFEEGYGLSRSTINDLAARGTGLLVTVDCGISAAGEVQHAREAGMEVLVTDHHRPGDPLPDCPLLHPGLGGYPFPELCATAVAYKLARALLVAAELDPRQADEDLDLVALATVADLVPLRGENRRLVREGLRALAATTKPGLRALMAVARVDPGTLDARAVGYRLAPRINAAGRLHHADAGLELVLTEDGARAEQVADELDAVNRERQETEDRVLFAADAARRELPDRLREAHALVLAGEGWHPGVIGIVASRLVERNARPCVLVALAEDSGRGSGRSIPAYDLHAGLAACSGQLRRFGGHAMAAGLELDRERLEPFREAFVAHAGQRLRPEDLVRTERVDALVGADALGLDLAEELEQLEPFGQGNPGVSLLVPAARVEDVRPMGEEGKHARFTVVSGGARARGVGFGTGPIAPAGDHDLAFRLEANEWNGSVEPRLVLRGLYPATCSDPDDLPEATGSAWWGAVRAEVDRNLASWPPPAAPAPSEARREPLDWRGRGVLGLLGELISTGENVAVVCADVSRRRELVLRQLSPSRLGGRRPLCASVRSDPAQLGRRVDALGPEREVALADHETAWAAPALLECFTHVVALDPPWFPHQLEALRRSPQAPDEAGFLHLSFGGAELDFSEQILEQELGLRAPLAAIYRALRELPEGAEGTELEALLAGSGRHRRTPQAVGRCLRILTEVGLVAFDPDDPPRCRVRDPAGSTALEGSEAFRFYAQRHEEARRSLRDAQRPGYPPA